MKEFLLKTVVFVSVAALFVIVLAKFDNIDANYNSNTNIVSLQNKSNFEDLDILFLGNSYSYSGIQPAILDTFGIKSLNAGIASSGPQFYQLILNDYLESVSEKPKAVFILLSPMTFSNEADNFTLYPIHRYLENPISNIRLIFKYGLYDRILPLYKKSIRKSFTNIFISKTDIQEEKNEYLKNRGFISYYTSFSIDNVEEREEPYLPLKSSPFIKEKVDILETVSKNLKEEGIKVVYFELPVNVLANYFSRDFLTAYESTLNKLDKDHILTRIDSKLFSYSDYRNIDHMNLKGSEIATLELVKKIFESEELSDLLISDNKYANETIFVN